MLKLIRNFNRNIHENIRENRRVFLLYTVLRVLVIVALVRAIMNGNYNGAFICLLSLGLFLVPSLLEQGFKIHIPPLLEGTIYLFIFSAEILGELNHFYAAIPQWDTILHTLNGFLAAAVGFSMIDLLNRNSRHFQLSPFYLVMVAFCFSMTIGVIWEFFEWSADQFLLMDMQKDSLVSSINSIYFDPNHSQKVIHIPDITETIIHTADGTTYTVPGISTLGLTTPWAISSSISSAPPPSASSATSVCATPVATKKRPSFLISCQAANRTPPSMTTTPSQKTTASPMASTKTASQNKITGHSALMRAEWPAFFACILVDSHNYCDAQLVPMR